MAFMRSRGLVVSAGRRPGMVRVVLYAGLLVGVAVVFQLRTSLASWAFASGSPSMSTVSAASLAVPGGSLVICGGGKLPDQVRDRFLELAGGPKARIVVIPTAHAYADTPQVKQALEFWKGQPLASVSLFHTRSRAKADDKDYVRPLAEATGVWIGGGRQQYLTDVYLGTEVERQLKALLDRGGVIGGTSAGAAVMTRVMIDSGRTEAKVAQGFDFLEGVVVDQHFLKRGRHKRLLGVVRQHPDLIGLGIDEQTALVVNVRSKRIKVIGNSYVVACFPTSAAEADRADGLGEPSSPLEFLRPGDEADLSRLRSREANAVIPGLDLDLDTVGAL
jgi:cyanophycinase